MNSARFVAYWKFLMTRKRIGKQIRMCCSIAKVSIEREQLVVSAVVFIACASTRGENCTEVLQRRAYSSFTKRFHVAW